MREEILQAVGSVAPQGSTVLDLFAGTGVVSAALARRYHVLASDVQEYSRVLTSALSAPAKIDASAWVERARDQVQTWTDKCGLTELLMYEAEVLRDSNNKLEFIAEFLSDGSLEGTFRAPESRLSDLKRGLQGIPDIPVLFRYYGGVYFSYAHALFLDALSATIQPSDKEFRDTQLAIVIGLASELGNSIGGHFAQPIRPVSKAGQLKTTILESVRVSRLVAAENRLIDIAAQYASLGPLPYSVTPSTNDFTSGLEKALPLASCVYADPPYTREHYSRFYHVLETIALGDNPGISSVRIGGEDVPSRGLYRLQRHQSPFSIVSEAPKAFDHLFRVSREHEVPVVLSYSPVGSGRKPRARTIDIETLVQIARRYWKSVSMEQVEGVKHARLNRRGLSVEAPSEAEVLLVARF